MKNIFASACVVLQLLFSTCAFGQHTWSAAIRVVDENGNAVTGANVMVFYKVQPPPGHNYEQGPDLAKIQGTTDANGNFTASHTDSSFDLSIEVSKAGYYNTRIGHQFDIGRDFDKKISDANSNPSFTLLLKQIDQPIAMYAKSITDITFPKFNGPIGYDLRVGDWVAPYGKGVNQDVLFTENHLDSISGYTFTVSFPRSGDGIQGFSRNWSYGVSGLQSLHEAPVDGYQSVYEQTNSPDQNRIYYFRVQTVLDSHGNVLSANYGKIYGDFMQFRYYLNPTPNSRNIEFDPKQNLVNDIQSFDRVSAP